MTKPCPKPGDPDFVPPGNINCSQCTDFILDYVEGRLPAEQRASFEQHTSACAPCEIYLKNYRRVTEMASRAGAAGPDAGPVPARIIEAILKARQHHHGGANPPTAR